MREYYRVDGPSGLLYPQGRNSSYDQSLMRHGAQPHEPRMAPDQRFGEQQRQCWEAEQRQQAIDREQRQQAIDREQRQQAIDRERWQEQKRMNEQRMYEEWVTRQKAAEEAQAR